MKSLILSPLLFVKIPHYFFRQPESLVMSSIIALIFRLTAKLPLSVLYYLGSFSGSIAYFLAPQLRRRIRENLRQADLPCDTKTA
ncbi:MAG: hypothetical protein IJM09_00795, partial [Neisseriaceae bacterium]|nr:hypothetical protein [Neisseriaceae bacterium]